MSSLNLDINLMKLSRVGVVSIHGVKCVVIPVVENDIFISTDAATGKAKSAHLHLTAWEHKNGPSQYGDTHMLKLNTSEEYRAAHTEEELKSMPILGGGKPIKTGGNQAETVTVAPIDNSLNSSDDLPF